MKKTAFTVIVFVIVVALALVCLQQKSTRSLHASDLAPGSALVFFHLPDVQRSQLRWPQTALAKIAAEPEVQAFLAKPRSKVPEMKEVNDTLEKIARAQVGEAFLALTEADESSAKFVAGVSFAGSPADVEALIAPLREEVRKALPDGKSGEVMYGKDKIETFTKDGTTVAMDIHGGGWLLIANDLDTLEAAIDRANGKAAGPATSLAQNEQFAGALAAVPKEADLEVYADTEAIARRVLPLITASGTPVPAAAQEMIKQAKALAYAIKMDGAQFHEAAFIVRTGGAAQPQLPLHALAASTAATAILLSDALPTSALAGSASSMLALVPGFADLEKSLAAAGVKPADFGTIFGPEMGAVLDWPADDGAPSFALTIDLRDAAKAKAAATALTADNPAWTKSEHAGALVLTTKSEGQLALLQPTIGLGDKFAVIGFSPEGVKAVLDRATATHQGIDTTPAFQTAAKLVAAPTSSFAFVDLKTLFERTYGTLRPLALLALALQPEASQYIDAGKLPNTATIAQHLSPIVFSNSTSERGTLIESTGPMTLSQLGALFGGAAAGVASSGQVKPGGLIDPGALGLPQIPGLTPAPAKPAAPSLPTLPEPTLPEPTLPEPTLPEPTLPEPTLPEPTLPEPTLPEPPAASPKPEVNPAEKQ